MTFRDWVMVQISKHYPFFRWLTKKGIFYAVDWDGGKLYWWWDRPKREEMSLLYYIRYKKISPSYTWCYECNQLIEVRDKE